jgi:hypothetical protein
LPFYERKSQKSNRNMKSHHRHARCAAKGGYKMSRHPVFKKIDRETNEKAQFSIGCL